MRVGRKKISTSCLIVSKYVMIVKKKKKKRLDIIDIYFHYSFHRIDMNRLANFLSFNGDENSINDILYIRISYLNLSFLGKNYLVSSLQSFRGRYCYPLVSDGNVDRNHTRLLRSFYLKLSWFLSRIYTACL